MYRMFSLTAATLLCAFAAPNHLSAAEIKILSPGSTEGAFSQLLPQFEKTAGHKVTIEYGPVGALAARVRKGEAIDIAILSEPTTEELRKQGKLVAGSEVVIAKVGIGAFVRKGDPKPDISSVDAFLRALTSARVIAYADPSLGGSTSILVGELMKSLDVTGSIGPKTKLVPPAKPLLDLVAGGGVDFGFNPMFLRIPFAASMLISPTWGIATYFALGVVVLASRQLFPKVKVAKVGAVESSAPANEQRELAEAA